MFAIKINKKQLTIRSRKGAALVMTMMVISALLFMALYFLNFSTTEKKITNIQTKGVDAYYLAEAGINEMVWLIQNDATYKNNFETIPDWTTSFTRNTPFGNANESYTVTITNSGLAQGEIVSVGSITNVDGSITKRTVKTFVYRALGDPDIGTNAIYANGNINITGSIVNFYNGGAHSNNNFVVSGNAQVYIEQDLEAVNRYIKSSSATATIGGNIYAINYPPAADVIDMPAVDFNSTSSSSFLNRADVVYDSITFNNLINASSTLTLNDDITYVSGDVNLPEGKSLIINGLLVIDGDFTVGANVAGNHPNSNLLIHYATGTPAGVLVSGDMYFKNQTGIVNVRGVLYANDILNINNVNASLFIVRGAMIARKFTISSSWIPIDIYYDSSIIINTLNNASTSPTLIVDHWEEEY